MFGNVGSLISLRVGIDDAHVLQKELGQFTDEDLLNLRVGEAIVRMGMAKDSFNLRIPLVEQSSNDYTQEILKLAKQKQSQIPSPSPVVPAITTQTNQNQPAVQNNPTNQSDSNLSKEEQDLLEFIYKKNEPLSFTKLAKEIKISTRQLYKLVGNLSDKNLMAETKIALATSGRNAKVVIITPDGIAALGYSTPTAKGGAVHQYFQRLIKSHAEKQGYQVKIEKHLGEQKSVDLSLEKTNQKIAVEISISSDAPDELKNIEKCLSADYDRIIVLSPQPKRLENLKKLVEQTFNDSQKAKIFISPLNHLFRSLFRSI